MKFSKLLTKVAKFYGDPTCVVSFELLGDGAFMCTSAHSGAIDRTPKRALMKLLVHMKDGARRATEAKPDPPALTAGRTFGDAHSEPEAVGATMRLLGIDDVTDYAVLYQKVDAQLVELERLRRKAALVDTLVAMVRRAAAEMQGRVLRETFEKDLVDLLKENES